MAERNQTVKGKDSLRKVKDCGENQGIPKQEVVFNLCRQTSFWNPFSLCRRLKLLSDGKSVRPYVRLKLKLEPESLSNNYSEVDISTRASPQQQKYYCTT